MMRVFGWISRLLLTAVLISTISVLTTWTVVHLYVNQLLQSFNMQGYVDQVKLSDVLASAVGGLSIKTGGNLKESIDQLIPEDQGHLLEGETSNASTDDSHSADESDQAEPEMPRNAIPVWGAVTEQESSQFSEGEIERQESQASDQLVMSEEELSRKKEQLSTEDKMQIFTLLISRLSEDQLQRLSSLMEQGITEQELKEVEHMLREHLDAKDFEHLLQLMQSYE